MHPRLSSAYQSSKFQPMLPVRPLSSSQMSVNPEIGATVDPRRQETSTFADSRVARSSDKPYTH